MSIAYSDLKYIARKKSVRDLIQFEVENEYSANLMSPGLRWHRYLELSLNSESEKVNGGVRSEISLNYLYEMNDVIIYTWRMMIPEDFQNDPDNRSWVMAQWHDQPDLNKGETWEGFPSHSPTIGLYYGRLGNQDYLSLEYLDQIPQAADLIPIERGKFLRMYMIVRWSRGEQGSALLLSDNKNASFSGPNMRNDYPHYWKLGMYRHPEIKTNNVINLDSIDIDKA